MKKLRSLRVPPADVPYFDVRGNRDGPQLTVLAGVHGAEYCSIAAARKFVLELDPAAVRGRIVVVPVVNVAAFWARTPFVVPGDGLNLNRQFPGDPAGSTSQVLADAVFSSLVVGADFLVDLHAGDIPEALVPFTIFEESAVEGASRMLADAYGLPHCVRQPASARTVAGSTCAAAADVGIPAIVAEAGANGLLEQSFVDLHLTGLRNVARTVGVLDGEVVAGPPVEQHDGWHWLRTKDAGWWQPAVPVGADVEAGDVLGTVGEVWGTGAVDVVSPDAGTVLFLTSSPAVSADGLLLGLARRHGRISA